MKKNNLKSRGIKKCVSIVLTTLLFIPLILNNGQFTNAASSVNKHQVYHELIASGIYFQENNYHEYQDNADKRQREYIITADLNDPTVQIISAKAHDKILKLDTVSSQIANEQAEGQNIVAGINGDMFNISLGTMHYGAPQGLQVKDGKILVGFETIGSGPRYPVFAIDKNHEPIIAYLSMDNRLSVVDSKYEKIHGSANPNLTTAIDTINRNNTQVMDNKMILLTPQLADIPIVGFTDEQASNATLTVLKNISYSADSSVKLGREYEAEVVSIGDTSTGVKSIGIPADGMVLASQGIKATWVKEHLKAGDKVRFSFNLKDQTGKRLDLEQAVTAWLPLVENGQALTKEEMLEICQNDWDHGTATIGAMDKARTAIGFTHDNKVIALVFDGSGAVSDSHGIDLPGMALRMQELGVVAAVSLDGGGSTQMNTRLFGETGVKLINHPADGKERPVSNTILFASNAPKTNDIKELRVKNQDITIFKNASYAFQVRGQDSNGNPADLSKVNIKWSIDPVKDIYSQKNGDFIDENGLFTAGILPGIINVSASLGSVESSARITVVDTVDTLAFTDSGVIAVQPTVAKQLQIIAYTQEGQPIVIANDAVEWAVTPSSIATIDKQGLLTPLGKGNGVVSAKLGDKEVLLNFVSGLEAQLIDSYETYDNNSYYVDGFIGGRCEISTELVKDGQHSLRVDYDYANWAKVYNGTINVHMNADTQSPGYKSSIRPKKLGMWVYGDGTAPWLRAIIKDGNGKAHTINLASRIDWVGWKHVSVDIPADIPAPVTLDYFYMVETDKSKEHSGTVYFDDVRFIYFE